MIICLPVGLLGIGSSELLIVLAVAMILLGPKELPKIARSIGKFMAHLRSVSDDFQSQVMHIGDEVASTVAEEKPAEYVPETPVVETPSVQVGSSDSGQNDPGVMGQSVDTGVADQPVDAGQAAQVDGNPPAAAVVPPPEQNKDAPK